MFAPVESVTINGVTYAKGAIIHTIDTGVYEVICTDAAGNVWTDSFTATTVNVPTQTLQQEYWEATDKDGNAYSFENYDNAFAKKVTSARANGTMLLGIRVFPWTKRTP